MAPFPNGQRVVSAHKGIVVLVSRCRCHMIEHAGDVRNLCEAFDVAPTKLQLLRAALGQSSPCDGLRSGGTASEPGWPGGRRDVGRGWGVLLGGSGLWCSSCHAKAKRMPGESLRRLPISVAFGCPYNVRVVCSDGTWVAPSDVHVQTAGVLERGRDGPGIQEARANRQW